MKRTSTPGACEMSPAVLRAAAERELQGDGAGEVFAHVAECPRCSALVGMLRIADRCDQAIGVLAREERPAAWVAVAEQVLSLPETVVIFARKKARMVARWADGALVRALPLLHDTLGDKPSTQVGIRIPIEKGDGEFPWALTAYPQEDGLFTVTIELGQLAPGSGRLKRVQLFCDGDLREGKTPEEAGPIEFGSLECGRYQVVLILGNGKTHEIGFDLR